MANVGEQFTLYSADAYSEPCQASKMKLFVKIVNYIQSLFIFTKSFILDVGQASELTSVQYIIKVNKPNKVKTNKDTCYISALETLKEP